MQTLVGRRNVSCACLHTLWANAPKRLSKRPKLLTLTAFMQVGLSYTITKSPSAMGCSSGVRSAVLSWLPAALLLAALLEEGAACSKAAAVTEGCLDVGSMMSDVHCRQARNRPNKSLKVPRVCPHPYNVYQFLQRTRLPQQKQSFLVEGLHEQKPKHGYW